MSLDLITSKNTTLPWTVKRQLIIAAISFVVGAILFVLAYLGMSTHGGLGKLDQPVLDWMVQHRESHVTVVMKVITTIASPVGFAVILSLGAVVWAVVSREIWRPLLLFGSTGAAALVAMILKKLFVHVRPPEAMMLKPFETDYSFPSGHTIAITTCVLVIGYLICSRRSNARRITSWILVSVIGVGLVASSRLYLGYHWLTDIAASIGLGLMILAVVIVIDKLFVREKRELEN